MIVGRRDVVAKDEAQRTWDGSAILEPASNILGFPANMSSQQCTISTTLYQVNKNSLPDILRFQLLLRLTAMPSRLSEEHSSPECEHLLAGNSLSFASVSCCAKLVSRYMQLLDHLRREDETTFEPQPLHRAQ